MIKTILIAIVSLCCSALAIADQLQLREGAPKTYVVQKGDTLWDISAMYLNEPWLWPKLWRINSDIINPHLIYPGDELNLVFDAKGQPMLVKGKPELRWSPKVRKTLKERNPVTYIPFDTVAPYLDYATVLSAQQINEAPYVLGGDEAFKSSMQGATLYIKGDLAVDKTYAIYKRGEEVFDPENGESLGYHAQLIGTGRGIKQGNIANKTPSSLYLTKSIQEIRAGSIVLPVSEGQLYPAFYGMQAVEGKVVDARMIRSRNLVREFGKFEVVLLNKGAKDNLAIGEVYKINRQSPAVVDGRNGPTYLEDSSVLQRILNGDGDDSDVVMPTENIGHLMVFKVLDDTSYAIVLGSQKSVHITDEVSAP
ncbi:LysM peptidoglycan-binding domain-containing protein [Thalassotalea maritima]|uniref:LysM peptidoglycan-binding domain-containing protein n=1 Tax=Thalassotalea maritima TaxID=3242416 RepID=UPI003528110E